MPTQCFIWCTSCCFGLSRHRQIYRRSHPPTRKLRLCSSSLFTASEDQMGVANLPFTIFLIVRVSQAKYHCDPFWNCRGNGLQWKYAIEKKRRIKMYRNSPLAKGLVIHVGRPEVLQAFQTLTVWSFPYDRMALPNRAIFRGRSPSIV